MVHDLVIQRLAADEKVRALAATASSADHSWLAVIRLEGMHQGLVKNAVKPPWFYVAVLGLMCTSLTACNEHREEPHPESHKIVVTTPQQKAVTLTEKYVCQIHSSRHIEVRALERGYLEQVSVREGQAVKKGEAIFKLVPTIYKAKMDAEVAQQELAELQFEFAEKLKESNVVSKNELSLKKAELAKAEANVTLARAQLNFATVKAPFDGIVDRQLHQLGSLVEEGDILTTLSDNTMMWVYFNVPEQSYLDYMTNLSQDQENLKIELLLANHKKFPQMGKINTIEAEFNNRTGNIPFRADFPNPNHLLRHGQTGTILISRVQKHALVIPQRATFQVLDKRYAYVVDEQNVAHQREIMVENELEDIFVIKQGLAVNDKFVLEGIRQVHDGDKVEFEERQSEQVLAHLKYHAE